jgi:hypothetical protein
MKVLAAFIVLALSIILSSPSRAVTQQEAEAALTAARQVESEAGRRGDRWVPAEAALKAAQAAMDAKDWDKAASAAAEARALAERAIQQSKDQETVWQDAVIH